MSKPPYSGPARTAGELAERWEKIERPPPDEAKAFADDIDEARRKLPPVIEPRRKLKRKAT